MHLTWVWSLWKDGLRSTPFVPSYDLRGQRLTIDRSGHDGFAGHQGDRRARELAERGEVYREIRDKGIAYYAAADPESVAKQGAML